MKNTIAFLLLLSIAACSQREQTQYEKDGTRVSVPGDCKVAKDKYLNESHTSRAIHIECPGNAVFSIISIPASSPETLEQFAANVATRRASGIQQKLSVGGVNLGNESGATSEASQAKIKGSSTEGVRQRFSVDILGQKVPHIAEFYMLQTPQHKIVLMTQAAETHLQESRVRWQTIFDSIAVE